MRLTAILHLSLLGRKAWKERKWTVKAEGAEDGLALQGRAITVRTPGVHGVSRLGFGTGYRVLSMVTTSSWMDAGHL